MTRRTTRTAEDLRALAAVARGDAPADLFLEGGRVLNIYSGEVLEANVAVARGRIAYVGMTRTMLGPQTHVLSVAGRLLVPGYIDPHGHPPAFANPVALAAAILPLGTTAVVMDTLMILLHAAPGRAEGLLAALSTLPLRFFWFLRLHAQAPDPREADLFARERLRPLLRLESVRAVGEITRWPALYRGDPSLTDGIAEALAAGRRVEGHAPGVGAERLQALAAAGISSDHEAITPEQALDRLRAGLFVMLRHSSIRRDLPALASVATGARAFSGRLMLTPDGPNAAFIADEGYMDHLIGAAIDAGVDPIAAYQMATINPVTYYGLDEELGGIAPGRAADINVLTDLRAPRPEIVIAGGRIAAAGGRLLLDLPEPEWEAFFPRAYAPTWRPAPGMFALPAEGTAPALHLENEVITRRIDVPITGGRLPPGVQRLALVDATGGWITRGLISGFAERLEGLASTFSIARGVTVIGDDPAACAAAAQRVLEIGGGVVLVEDGAVLLEVPLPLAGMMSPGPLPAAADAVRRLSALLRERGYRHADPTYSLLFLSFDSLPDLRLTYRGLWDVKAQRVLIPRVPLHPGT
ncbi:MAG: adenine deaminase [Armatimonadetes bacterium]|nr:adenine deaminase [Armatimonadota bacterium]